MTPLHAATVSHAPALALVHAGAFPPAGRWDAATMARQLVLPGIRGWIAEAGGMILLRTVLDEAEILTIAVAPTARRQGLGGALLACAIAAATQAGAVSMVLEVGVSNHAARRLYAAAGFAPAGHRRGYYADGEDALILRAGLCG